MRSKRENELLKKQMLLLNIKELGNDLSRKTLIAYLSLGYI
jgi:hypothetical protein